MLRTILILLMLSLGVTGFSACGSEEPDPNLKPAMKTGEIIEKYVETLVTAPGKARDAGAMLEEQQRRTEEMLQQLEE